MKSEGSMKHPIEFSGMFPDDSRIQCSPESSCLEKTSSEKLSFPKRLLLKLKKDEKFKPFQSHTVRELSDLELRDNELQDSGVRALSAGLKDPHCKLRRLGLSGCRVTQRGCDYLASALRSNPSHLRELDLRYNHPGDSGVRALSAATVKTFTLLLDHRGENRTKPGSRKYGCQLTLDPNTANRGLSLFEGNRKTVQIKLHLTDCKPTGASTRAALLHTLMMKFV
ncbi:hypothetical protein SKAU_G00046350 [Synaphobranchus kaupii]|uniref:Uncharacterized protein n=1 Tax=Synaphobranchus kaupii TaxID=118154 RepID=A0A9Q1J9B2_SYNKA|nr:hypothetical protein SKAU_G00046350 [Synaphobranchus kaupii]